MSAPNSDGAPSVHPEPPSNPYYGGPLGAGIDWTDPHSPLAPFYFSTAGVFAAALLGLSFFLLSIFPLMHTDFWSHLKYGEWIITHRTIPSTEPLNRFTDKEQTFFDAMWLSQVVYHAAFQLGRALGGPSELGRFEGGVEMVRLLHLLAATTALGYFAWSVRRASDSTAWGVAALIYGMFMLQPLLIVQRPQTLAFVPFMVLLAWLSRLLASPQAVAWRIVWQLPLLLVVWANLHGSFVLGLLLTGVLLIGLSGEQVRRTGYSLQPWKTFPALLPWWLALLAAFVAVGTLNPYGPQLYWHVAQFGRHPNLRTMAEWQPLEWTWQAGGHWGYLFTMSMLGGTLLVTRCQLGIGRWLLIIAIGIWPVFQQRVMAWWAPLALWIIAPCWSAWAKEHKWCWPHSTPSFRKTALASLILGVAVIASPASNWFKTGRPRSFATALYPATPFGVALALRGEDPHGSGRAQRLQAASVHTPDDTAVVFCSERLGEYLLWALPPSMPVMMYNHAQLFSPEYWAECLAVKEGQDDWPAILRKYDARWIVVEILYHPRLCSLLRQHAEWEVLLDEAEAWQLPEDARLLVARRR